MFFDLKKGLFIDDNKNNNKILAINWNITGLCLNKCTYCYGSDIFNYRTLDTSEFLSLIKTIRMIHPDLLVISGGEPLLCSDLELIIKEIKKAKINMIVDTSGVISLDKYIELLQQAKVHVRISIDSSQHEENERIRRSTVPNSTSIVKNNISLLISKKYHLQFRLRSLI